jgi:hypothetical protein
MLVRLAIIASVACLSVTACDRTPEPGFEPTPFMIWTANLEHLLPEHNWPTLVDRMSARSRDPDLIFLEELDLDEGRTVLAALEKAFDIRYRLRHAPIGKSLVAWNPRRFTIAHENTSLEPAKNELLWKPFGSRGCRAPSKRDPGQVVAVRLWDKRERRTMVAAGVHWGRTWAAACMEKNLVSLDSLLEKTWPERNATVVGGDFNAHPDKQPHPDEPERENLDSGRETDPDCWYRNFSALHDNEVDVRRLGESSTDCEDTAKFSSSSDSYYDAVFVAAGGTGDGLCEQWTSLHGLAAAKGTSCTDTNDDGLRDRGRIDYIWVRWEDGDGRVIPFDASEAAGLIEDASADRVCVSNRCSETRYSDHRAVWAEVSQPK